jgi:hypothetical protein
MTTASIRRAISGLALCTAAGAVGLGAADALSPQESVRMQQKIAVIVAHAHADGPAGTRTEISETEVNSYLRYGLADAMPAGVTDPAVVIVGGGRLSGRAVVDLSRAAKETGSGGLFDPLTYLTGRLPVAAAGVLHTKGGAGTFELESASVSGVPIPKRLLQEILTAYSRSASRPGGLSLDEPFALPAGIREIEITPGQAVIVQ